MMLLERLAKSAASVHWQDTTKPGVTVACLGGRDWYVSVVRYLNGTQAKVVVCSAKGATMRQALLSTALAWCAINGKTKAINAALGGALESAVKAALS